MSKKNDYSKLFGGKTKLDFDVKKKSRPVKSGEIFFTSEKGKKKKNKKKNKKGKTTNIKKIVRRTVGVSDEDNILSNLFVWSKVEDVDHIKTFKDLGENARGLFIIKIKVDDESSAFIPVCITEDGKIIHTENAAPIETVFAKFATGSDDITDTDIDVASEALYKSDIIEEIYNVDMNKLVNCICSYGSLESFVAVEF